MTKDSKIALSNADLIRKFYEAFQQRDFRTMQDLYSDEAKFSDAVFQNLNAQQVRSMWQMLIERGKDLHLEFSDIETDGDSGSAVWVATYTFSRTKRKVINRISANFQFQNQKIVNHQDNFDFYKWARQAFGPVGVLIGWTSFFKKKVQKQALAGLDKFTLQHQKTKPE